MSFRRYVQICLTRTAVPGLTPQHTLIAGEVCVNTADDVLHIGVADGFKIVRLVDIPEPLQSILREGTLHVQVSREN